MQEFSRKMCPTCGWDDTEELKEDLVYLHCPLCETPWLDEEALARSRNRLYEQRPDFLAKPGRCTICGWYGEVHFTFCMESGAIIAECDECNQIWLDPARIVRKYATSFPQLDVFYPDIQGYGWNRRWATRREVIDRGFEDRIQEKGCSDNVWGTDKQMVDDAIRLFDFEGLASVVAFVSIENHGKGTNYVYIVDSDGYTLASPYPEMIGRDPALRVDSTGYFYGDDLLSATEEGKWIGHTILMPRTQEMMYTESWVVHHEGLFFASGKYPEGIVGWP